jgi:soluble lytic murein transglycosylase
MIRARSVPVVIAVFGMLGLGAPAMAVSPPAKPEVPAKSAQVKAKTATKPIAAKPRPAAEGNIAKLVPMPRARPVEARAPLRVAAPKPLAVLATASAADGNPFPLPDAAPVASGALAYGPTAAPSGADLEALKEALGLAARGKLPAAAERAESIRDAAAQKLIEWVILRADDGESTFSRYAKFIQANPHWPGVGMLRRRAEGQLWQEKRDAATVLAFFAATKPTSAKGRLALGRALLTQGNQAAAQQYAREAWRQDPMSEDLEAQALESFGELLSRADHKARMDRLFYAEEVDGGMRAAQRLGGNDLAIARARAAVIRKAGNTGAMLEAVPNDARGDPGYVFSRAQWLRRNDRVGEAAQLMLSASHDPDVLVDTNEWWVERRLIARKLLDADNAQAAYQIARDAAPPTKENPRIEHQFTAGWIALRFLNDPATAQRHFGQMAQGVANPISLARASYWQGRAAEAAGRGTEAQSHYEVAARFPTAYYGQLARVRLGRNEIPVRRPPELTESQRASLRNTDVVRAVELLYAVDERDLVMRFVTDLSDKSMEIGALVLVAELAARHGDARATLLVGKTALGRGFTFDHFAFPNIGVPKYASIGPEADRSVVFSIARQESAFNARVVSSANAMGLMQVTPGTGRLIAKKHGVAFDQKRLLNDPVYNAQMGSAELGELIRNYDGNYILVFAAYNAGRGRVKEWVARYGDPRDPEIDPIDWVERIPFSETRNYVQRVMENMQVYRARFGSGRLTIEADLRGRKGE